MPLKPVVLCILDGWGLSDSVEGNAVAQAATPNFDRIWAECPHARLSASGQDVGLPAGQIGNSEVGHTNIGAGRVVLMDLPKIDNAIEDGTFFANPALVETMAKLKASGGTAHLIGLLSPGGVHSLQRHTVMLARAFSEAGIPVAVHAFMDGRDVGPTTGRAAMMAFLEDIAPLKTAYVATICGRFYAMDRDKRWDRVEKAHRLIARADGAKVAGAIPTIEAAYAAGVTDEFIEPAVIGTYDGMRDGDGLISVNFRADRAREILSSLLDPDFSDFDATQPRFATTLGMVSYSDEIDAWMPAMFPPEEIVNGLGEWVAGHGRTQMRLAETEKYPHVTFFLNGGIEAPDPGEDRRMAQSPKHVKTYDEAPEMAAGEVTEYLVAAIHARYDLVVVNYANPDMVGHTGSLPAAIAACEAVDRGLGAALAALEEVGGAMIVTADHGNAECMVDAEGGPHTAHTTNPVPCVLVQCGPEALDCVLADGRLGDLAPTILHLMELPQPDEMTGRSLLRRP